MSLKQGALLTVAGLGIVAGTKAGEIKTTTDVAKDQVAQTISANTQNPAVNTKTNYVVNANDFVKMQNKVLTLEVMKSFLDQTRDQLEGLEKLYGADDVVAKLKDIGLKYPDIASMPLEQQESIIRGYFSLFLGPKDEPMTSGEKTGLAMAIACVIFGVFMIRTIIRSEQIRNSAGK